MGMNAHVVACIFCFCVGGWMCSAKAYKEAYRKVEMKAARTHLEVLHITGRRLISKIIS